nr:hypothetical protein B0A51_00971 [Rachicladosporium sp. CCFEE 5018]
MADYLKIVQNAQPFMVTHEHPPREDVDGMDHARCAALHNAILKHGWVTSGRDAADFDRIARPLIDIESDSDRDAHPSVRAFLATALTLEDTSEFKDQKMNFFVYVSTLQCWEDWHDYCWPDGDDRALTLYQTLMGHASKADGLVYDQTVHKAIMHFDICHELKPDPGQPWRPFESVLTVWIEMVLCRKVVAMPDDVGREWHQIVRENFIQQLYGPKLDPKTGVRRCLADDDPWTIQSYTVDDISRTLATWDAVVTCIEQKMGLGESDATEQLLPWSSLSTAGLPIGFAREFLTHARKPRFEFIAPGLRIQDPQIFAQQARVGRCYDTPNILLFAGDDVVGAEHRTGPGQIYGQPSIPCQCGLYLLACERESSYPLEDGFSLVLPFAFPDRYHDPTGHANLSDGTPSEKHDSLLQLGVNTLNHDHAPQLEAFLDIVLANVKSRHWKVDRHGVAGGIDVWKAANTKRHWEK